MIVSSMSELIYIHIWLVFGRSLSTPKDTTNKTRPKPGPTWTLYTARRLAVTLGSRRRLDLLGRSYFIAPYNYLTPGLRDSPNYSLPKTRLPARLCPKLTYPDPHPALGGKVVPVSTHKHNLSFSVGR